MRKSTFLIFALIIVVGEILAENGEETAPVAVRVRRRYKGATKNIRPSHGNASHKRLLKAIGYRGYSGGKSDSKSWENSKPSQSLEEDSPGWNSKSEEHHDSKPHWKSSLEEDSPSWHSKSDEHHDSKPHWKSSLEEDSTSMHSKSDEHHGSKPHWKSFRQGFRQHLGSTYEDVDEHRNGYRALPTRSHRYYSPVRRAPWPSKRQGLRHYTGEEHTHKPLTKAGDEDTKALDKPAPDTQEKQESLDEGQPIDLKNRAAVVKKLRDSFKDLKMNVQSARDEMDPDLLRKIEKGIKVGALVDKAIKRQNHLEEFKQKLMQKGNDGE